MNLDDKRRERERAAELEHRNERFAKVIVDVGQKIYPLEKEWFSRVKWEKLVEHGCTVEELFEGDMQDFVQYMRMALDTLGLEGVRVDRFTKLENYHDVLYELNLAYFKKTYS